MNTRPSSRRVRGAHRTPSCGSTPRLASITTLEPAITGTPAGARICARLTRAPRDIARRRTANLRPGPLPDKGQSSSLRCRLAGFHPSGDVAAASSINEVRMAYPLSQTICGAVIARDGSVMQITLRHLHFMSNSSRCDRKRGKLVLVNEIVAGLILSTRSCARTRSGP